MADGIGGLLAEGGEACEIQYCKPASLVGVGRQNEVALPVGVLAGSILTLWTGVDSCVPRVSTLPPHPAQARSK